MYVTSTKTLITKYETQFQGTSSLAPNEIYYKRLLFQFLEDWKVSISPKIWKIIFPMIGKLKKGFENFRMFQLEIGKWMKPNHSLHGKNLNQYYGIKILSHVYFYFSCRYTTVVSYQSESVASKWELFLAPILPWVMK